MDPSTLVQMSGAPPPPPPPPPSFPKASPYRATPVKTSVASQTPPPMPVVRNILMFSKKTIATNEKESDLDQSPPPKTTVKRSVGPPPQPPPMPKGGNILTLSRESIMKKKVSKLKQSRQMGEMFMRLKLMLEGGSAVGKMGKSSNNEETTQAPPPPSTLSEWTTVLEIATPELTDTETIEESANESVIDSSLPLLSPPESTDETTKDSPLPPTEADNTTKDSSPTDATKAEKAGENKDSSPMVGSRPPVTTVLPRLLPSRLFKESAYDDEQDQGMHGGLSNEISIRFTDASPYFRRIEEDAEKYMQLISDVNGEIKSFESNDKAEIVKFRQYIDERLECLFDESKVLSRFYGFPFEKLERIRMAAGQICKLETISFTIKDWKLMSPVYEPLEKIEIFYDKIWREVNEIDLAKDEERKRFRRQNIDFDVGGLIITIKESLVDLSSNCIELALKENEKANKAAAETEANMNKVSKMLMKGSAKRRKQMLWKIFQFAYRVYNFAGGQDDRAALLTVQLAHEIETLHKIK